MGLHLWAAARGRPAKAYGVAIITTADLAKAAADPVPLAERLAEHVTVTDWRNLRALREVLEPSP